jgi:hypothetical protein
MASGSDSNGQGCGYFQIIYFCPNCKTPVDPLPWDYRGLPLYFDVLPTQMYPAWYGNQVQSTQMELFDPVVPQSDGGLDLVPQLGPVFVSVPQTDPLLVGAPHSDDVLGRIPQVVVDLMRSVPCFIDGSAVMTGSSHFEPSFEPDAAPDVTLTSDRPVDALMDEFMKSVPRFLETEDRNGRFSFEATFSKLWVRDGASNASIFATADGHSILLCHPMAKVWVQGGQVCATFSLPNQEQR